jgi:hypothetical protein
MKDINQLKHEFTIEADKYVRHYYPNYFPPNKNISNFGHNDYVDAFRHAYVSGRFTQAGYENTAQILGVANEVFSKNELPEREMDLWNNAKGRDFGNQTRTADELAHRIYIGIQREELILGIGHRPKSGPAEQYNIKPMPQLPHQRSLNDDLNNSKTYLASIGIEDPELQAQLAEIMNSDAFKSLEAEDQMVAELSQMQEQSKQASAKWGDSLMASQDDELQNAVNSYDQSKGGRRI